MLLSLTPMTLSFLCSCQVGHLTRISQRSDSLTSLLSKEKNMGTNGVLEIPCLGRPFQLAMFYDCRRDCLIPDTTILDSDILTNALVCRDQSGSRYKVFKGGSLPVKMEMMKAEVLSWVHFSSCGWNVPLCLAV